MPRTKKGDSTKNLKRKNEDLEADDMDSVDMSSPAEPLGKKKRATKSGRSKSKGRNTKIDDYFDPVEMDGGDLDSEELRQELKKKAEQGKIVEKEFDAQDQEKLSENEHLRFMPSSQKVGHALIGKDENGHLVAQQFLAPGTVEPDTSQIVPLKDIELVERWGAIRAVAKTEGGTPMMSVRTVHVKTNYDGKEKDQELFLFSPVTSHQWKGKPWWGSSESENPPIWSSDLDEEEKKDLALEMKKIKKKSKGGEVKIKPLDIPIRDDMTRNPSQNTVMGSSAIDAFEDFLGEYDDDLSKERRDVLQKSIDARDHLRTFGHKSQPRPEWLHALGHGLMPLDKEPQKESNLGAAPKWLNTRMMTTERSLKWHALNRPKSEQFLKVNFDMVLDSELIDKGRIEGKLVENNKTLQIAQDLNPWVKFPNYSKPTDIAQTTLVTHHVLTDVEPLKTTPVTVNPDVKQQADFMSGFKPAPKVQKDFYKEAEAVALEAQSNKAVAMKESKQQEDKPMNEKHSVKKKSVRFEQEQTRGQSKDMSKDEKQKAPPIKKSLKSKKKVSVPSRSDGLDPTAHPFERSVVQIASTFQFEDYENPWKGDEPRDCTGSGFIIEKNGRHYILTNAHVVENSTFLQVRLANQDKSYTAKPLQVSYQADMALLEVEDPEFQQVTEPVEFGDMVSVRDKVYVVGFPMGGDELSTTKGIISRIEVQEYAEAGEPGLMAQTDSAINPGNSGGPVFDGEKVVGIAFQGINFADGLGYMIPMPVVQHFLEDYFSPGPYKGFPMLSFNFQPLTNPNFHKSLRLHEKYTGVMLTRIDSLTDPESKLQKGDILHAVDGIQISNDGKAKIPGIGNRIDMSYLFQRKHVGEKVVLSVIRENPETKKKEMHKIPIELKWRPGQTKLIPGIEFEKNPTYFIQSGILFQPLTMNYLETTRGKALREMIVSDYGYLMDVPKKTAEDQIVIINRIFSAEHNKGYELYENAVVKVINGIKINNIQDALKAMEGNQHQYHRIEISSGEMIVVPNLSKEEHKVLLQRYRIPKDRSPDLRTGEELVQQVEAPKRAIPSILEMIAPKKPSTTVKPMSDKGKEEMVDDEDIDEDYDDQKDLTPPLPKKSQKAVKDALTFADKLDDEFDGVYEEEPEEADDVDSNEAPSQEEEESYERDSFVVDDDPKEWEKMPIDLPESWGDVPRDLLFSHNARSVSTPGLARVANIANKIRDAAMEARNDMEEEDDVQLYDSSSSEEEKAPAPAKRYNLRGRK